jgi:hypothetical protein
MNIEKILNDHQVWLETGFQEGSRADLRGADLRGADLRGADLRGADLRGAVLRGAVLRGADLRGADLRDTDLRDTDLRDTDLRGADLRGAAGNRREIKSIFAAEEYPITYTATHLQIGCQRHAISDWWKFDDKRILEMDGRNALKFWREWKDTLKMLIEKSPAKGNES